MKKKTSRGFIFAEKKSQRGFSLIELLVTMTVLAVLFGLVLASLGGARRSARDAKRRSDIQEIRSTLEMYRADCGQYPGDPTDLDLVSGETIVGDDSNSVCLLTTEYMTIPDDPVSSEYQYYYQRGDSSGDDSDKYMLCAFLESGGVVATNCTTNCSSATDDCNYEVNQP